MRDWIEELDNGMSVSSLKGGIEEVRSLVDGIWVYIVGLWIRGGSD